MENLTDNFNNMTIKNNIINRGLGAGGPKTNKNGLNYEEMTDLSSEYKIISKSKNNIKITFNNNEFICLIKKQFLKYMDKHIDKNICKAHGCKEPDECYINEKSNIIFIIEKKFQQTNGSVCEKIQTSDFKDWQYNRMFPKYKIIYIYCLSDWFKENCKAELQYLKEKKVPVFWGNDFDYKKRIVNFICG